MRISLAYNLKREDTEEHAELLSEEDVERLSSTLREIGHEVVPVEVSGPSDEIVDRLLASHPDLVFNVAEGTEGQTREAFYPAIYQHLGLPFTGGGAGLLLIDLDKRLCEKLLSVRGYALHKERSSPPTIARSQSTCTIPFLSNRTMKVPEKEFTRIRW